MYEVAILHFSSVEVESLKCKKKKNMCELLCILSVFAIFVLSFWKAADDLTENDSLENDVCKIIQNMNLAHITCADAIQL